MAISDQIGRLTTLRNNIRTKLIGLGILPAASTSATLSECYSVLSNVTGLGASSYTPTTTTQVIPSGRYLSGPQTINAIPSSYIIPTGTSVITSNSTYDIKQYASVSVNVQPALQSKTVTPTQAVQSVTPDAGIYGLSKVTVNAIPSSYIIPTGTITLSESGTFDVTSYASADVTVTGGPSGPYVEYNRNNSYTYVYNHSETYPYELFNRSVVFSGSNDIIRIASNAFRQAKTFSYISTAISSCSYIGDYAFYEAHINNSSAVKNLLENAEYIGTLAFGSSSYLGTSNIKFSSSINLSKCSYLGSGAFKYRLSIRYISAPLLESIVINGFQSTSYLSGMYAPKCSLIGDSAFSNVTAGWSEINFPSCTTVGAWAFFTIDAEKISFPLLSSIGGSAFKWNGSLLSLYLPALSIINAATIFESCANLSSVDFPELLKISAGGGSLFQSCTLLSYVSFPKLSEIRAASIFYSCPNLKYLNLPSLNLVIGSAFYGCGLSSFSFPELATISGTGTFTKCYSLLSAIFPKYAYTSATANTFDGCSSLSLVRFDKTSRISGAYMFRSCYHLISLFLLGSSVCALGNTIASMFSSTPVSTYSTSAGRWASIFVPQSLLASYKAATNWTTISSKIFAYESYFDANGNPL